MSFYVSTATFFLFHCDEWDRVVALPRHKFVTGATLLQLGTRYWTIRDLDETIRYCLVLINCQYFCTSSSLIYDPKVDGYVFLIVPV